MSFNKIDHPDHYQANTIEVIEIIEEFNLNFSLGNVIKYVLRAGAKPGEGVLEDLRKGHWYLSREIERLAEEEREAAREEAQYKALDLQDAANARPHVDAGFGLPEGFKSDLRGLGGYVAQVINGKPLC